MVTRTFWRRPTILLACLMVTASWCGSGHTQPQNKTDEPKAPVTTVLETPPLVPPEPPPPAIPEPAKSRPANVDGLIVQLEQIRAQKAEMDRQEREIVADLRRLLKRQQDRLDRLGIPAVEAPATGLRP